MLASYCGLRDLALESEVLTVVRCVLHKLGALLAAAEVLTLLGSIVCIVLQGARARYYIRLVFLGSRWRFLALSIFRSCL